MSSTIRRNVRYAPMDRSHIYGFSNTMPCSGWSTHLPIFKDEKKDDVGLHLVKFHIPMYVDKGMSFLRIVS